MKFRMNNFHLLLLCFFSGGLCSISVFTKTEGDDLSFGCFFNSSQSPKFFVKEHAKEKIILETRGVRAQKGKYSINYDTEFNVFYVKITQLDQSDSGRYRCGLGNASCPQSEREFEVRVTDAMCDGNTTLRDPVISVCTGTEGGSITVRCSSPSAGLFNLFFCRDACKKQDVLIESSKFSAQRDRYRIDYEKNGVFDVTIADLSKSDSGLYSCGVNVTSAPNPCQTVKISVIDADQSMTHTSLSGPGSCAPASAIPSIAILPTGAGRGFSKRVSENLEQQQSEKTGYLLPLVLCLAGLVVLVAVLLLLYRKIKRNSSGLNIAESSYTENIECSTY
ncbi:polymeric immunoglobulin receptor-like isoform X2 [Thunnus maccoyii]|uniref:polymeric immunoglobulin receptor-like isoform X2 n=1 Tax=Thunnus maccoyii TaxID=8240 RepID=UPI001C4A8E92|nr:polymeric immunoglobulin receptor-like isoform X2 [Thunnus maccoyii]